jgi:cyclic beta-1,2-glucan synthetase
MRDWCAAIRALIQLLDPPFNTSPLNPGYIKGYVPGVRENGGQYTHAAIWAAMAFAALGRQAAGLGTARDDQPGEPCPFSASRGDLQGRTLCGRCRCVCGGAHTGRGGWTWYTGSAGWLYRLIVESLLGLRLEVDTLHFAPCLPEEWRGFTLRYRYRETTYAIAITQTASATGEMQVTVDGVDQPDPVIPLVDDRREHAVEVRLMLQLG